MTTKQIDHTADIGKKVSISCGQENDLISRRAAVDIVDFECGEWRGLAKTIIKKLEALPAVQPDHNADVSKKVSISCGQENDLISRQAAIDALDEQIEQCNKALCSFYISPKDEYAIKVERASLEAYKEQLENMPSAQPEKIQCRDCRFNDGTAYCEFHFRDVKGEDYCSWAERRTDG